MSQIVVRPYLFRTAEMLNQQGIHPVLARLFAARGITDIKELSTEFSALLPPSELLHADKAAVFLADSILAGKKITVIADYDCDGATACAVAIRGLRMMGANVDFLVPNRFEYGYGLTPAIVALAHETKAPDILLTVDNGIASIEGVKAAKERGMEVLVTDHHLPGEQLPDAVVIVNPNQPACTFPSKGLSGVGVIFYVLLALRAEMRQRNRFDKNTQPRLDHLLDLVALGTVADVVKLDTNNRILVAQGLQRIRAGRMQPGLVALFRAAGRDPKRASPFDLAFAIAPRLNAAGRMADMALGIECLITDDEAQALDIASQLNTINRERREKEAEMQEDALDQLESFDPDDHATISILAKEGHQGVVGIISSRLKDKYFRPTITFAPFQDGQLITGSGRSIPGFHLRDALDLISKRYPDLIERFGGHAMAAGLTIRADQFSIFSDAFEAVGRDWLDYAQMKNQIETDGLLEDAFFTLAFIELLREPVWGQGFPHPLFSDEFKVKSQRVLQNKHVRLQLEKNGFVYDAIQFGRTDLFPAHARVAYRLDDNEFNGKTTIQLIVEYAEPV